MGPWFESKWAHHLSQGHAAMHGPFFCPGEPDVCAILPSSMGGEMIQQGYGAETAFRNAGMSPKVAGRVGIVTSEVADQLGWPNGGN